MLHRNISPIPPTQPFQKGSLFSGFARVPALKNKQIDFQPDETEESHVDFEDFEGFEGFLGG